MNVYTSCTLLYIGMVMYETSPDDPASVVSKLCHKHSSEAVLLGEYSMDGNKVHVHVHQYYMYMYV